MQSGRELPKLLEMGVLAVLLQTEVFLEKHKNDIYLQLGMEEYNSRATEL